MPVRGGAERGSTLAAGVADIGADGFGGTGGGAVGIAPVPTFGAEAAGAEITGAGVGAGAAGAAAAGAGAAFGADAVAPAEAPPKTNTLRLVFNCMRLYNSPGVIINSLAPAWTVAPSSTKSSVIMPSHGALTAMEVLSVSMWQTSSSSFTASPIAEIECSIQG